jgi:presqualene diphosphate synthase
MSLILPRGAAPDALARALAVCEEIASKDRSNLYLASQFFADRTRYDAFIAMYAVMRVIDDFVDDVGDKAALTDSARGELLGELDRWELRIRAAYDGVAAGDPLDLALASAVQTFPVPLRLWLAFVEAMRFDVRKARFDDFDEFLRYGEGATVAPTSIYVYLLTSQRQPDGRYLVTDFDFAACGRDLGLFAYIGHVLRDVRADLQIGDNGLVYLSIADLRAHALSESDLRELTGGSGTAEQRGRWAELVHDVCDRAQAMRERGTALARASWPRLPVDCAFIFRLIVEVYTELLDRIDADPERVLGPEPILSDDDKLALLAAAADATGYHPSLEL